MYLRLTVAGIVTINMKLILKRIENSFKLANSLEFLGALVCPVITPRIDTTTLGDLLEAF